LVLTKRDPLDDETFGERRTALLDELGWEGPVVAVSSVTRRGLDELVEALARHLEELRAAEPGTPNAADDDEPYDPLHI